VGKPFGRELLLTLRMIWEYNNKLHLRKISCGGWEMEVSASGSCPIMSFCTREVVGLTLTILIKVFSHENCLAILSLWTCQDSLVTYYFIQKDSSDFRGKHIILK